MVPIFQELHTEKPAAARHREGCISAIFEVVPHRGPSDAKHYTQDSLLNTLQQTQHTCW